MLASGGLRMVPQAVRCGGCSSIERFCARAQQTLYGLIADGGLQIENRMCVL